MSRASPEQKNKMKKQKTVRGFKNLIRILFLSVRPSFITFGIKEGYVDYKYVDIFTNQYLHFDDMVKVNRASRAEPVKAIAVSFGATFTPLGSDTSIQLGGPNTD